MPTWLKNLLGFYIIFCLWLPWIAFVGMMSDHFLPGEFWSLPALVIGAILWALALVSSLNIDKIAGPSDER